MILETGLEAYGMALFTRELGKSPEEVTQLFENAKAELKAKKFHGYQLQ